MDIKQRRLEILRRVGRGELSLADGNRLLQQLEFGMDGNFEENLDKVLSTGVAPGDTLVKVGSAPGPAIAQDPPAASAAPVESGEVLKPAASPSSDTARSPLGGWRSLWVLLFLFGLLITLFAATWIYQGFIYAGLSWGFWLSFIPFGLGVLLMWAGWEMRMARWLHVRIRQEPGKRPETISFGIPLPIGLTRWAVKRFGRFSPIPGQDIGDFLDEMDQAVANEGPMHISVEERDGQQVEIWIEGSHN